MLCSAVPTSEEALTSRLLHSTIQALEVFSVYLGKELGLYAALSSGAEMTPPDLARAAGIAPRYAREWLEQQAVAGLLRVASNDAPADERRYRLPAEHLNVLVTEDHPAHLAPLAQMVAGIGGVMDRVVEAYRSGGGVPYLRYTAPRSARGKPGSTGRHSSRTWSNAGFRPRPTCTSVSRRLDRASPTSAVAADGRRLPPPAPTPDAKSSASTPTTRRSRMPARMRPLQASRPRSNGRTRRASPRGGRSI
jgi:hypothetical protein